MKRSISMILAIIVALTLVISVYAASGDTTVYRTASGSKYHTENCASLKGNGIAITLQEAVDKGLTPCSKCNPPTLDEPASSGSSEAAASAGTAVAAGTTAAAVSAVSEQSGGFLSHVSPVLTFVIGFLAGAVVMVIIYRKFAPAVLAAQAEEEDAETPEE